MPDVHSLSLFFGSLGSGSIGGSGGFRTFFPARSSSNSSAADMPTMQLFDMTNNCWGTTNPDSIRAWIYDGKDDEGIGVVVDFEPFKNEQVAAEKTSLSYSQVAISLVRVITRSIGYFRCTTRTAS